jgi:predicted porin
MTKKILTLAVATIAAGVAQTAMAQGSNPVTLYGLVDLTFENVRSTGGAVNVSSRNRITSQASRLGVRGRESLGGGMNAFFQIETQVNVDDGTNAGTRGLASRNSGVGLDGGFGTFVIGRWDTPYKLGIVAIDPFGDLYLGGLTSVMHDNGNFDRREDNMVQYWTPNLGGFQGRVHYSVNENPVGGTKKTNTVSMGGTYSAGPLYAHLGYERHNNINFGTTAAPVLGKETGVQLAAAYTAGPVRFGGAAERIKKDGRPTAKAYMLVATYTAGPWSFPFSFQTGKDHGVSGAKATTFAAGANYALSKRTTAYGNFAVVRNNDKSARDFGFNKIVPAAGSDPRGFGVGLKHTF